jgi:WD40 repeat protein
VTTADGVAGGVSVRARIDRLRAANPAAADLAALCALAVRVEPELLRRLRLLLPGADVTAESDLWASDLLAGASARGIALDPRVADELRADLRMPRWEPVRRTAWQLIASSHRGLHWSLRLEEQVNRHVVEGVPLRGHDAPVTALLAVDAASAVSADRDGAVWRWRLLPEAPEDRQLATAGPAVLGACRVLVSGALAAFVSWDEAGQLAWWDHDGRRFAVRRPDDIRLPIRTVLCDDGSLDVRVVHAGGLKTVAAPTVPDDPVDGPYLRQLALLDADTVVLGTRSGTVRHRVTGGYWTGYGTPGPAAAGLATLSAGTLLCAWADGTAEIRHDSQGTTLEFLQSPARLVTSAGSAGGVVCDADGRLVAVTTDGSVLGELPPKVPQATALAAPAAYGSPPDFLLVGDARGDVTAVGAGGLTADTASAGQAPVTAVTAVGGWCVAGTAEGTVLRWRPDEPAMTILGRHDGPVQGLAAVGDRIAASASADGTVRLWDVEHSVDHAIVAGPEPFHAVAYSPDQHRLVARAGAETLWLLDLDPALDPRAPATAPDEVISVEVGPEVEVGPGPGIRELADGLQAATVRVWLYCTVPCEIRAAQWRIDAARLRRVPASAMQVAFDDNGRFAERLEPTGRLAVPRRFPPGQLFPLWARQEAADGWLAYSGPLRLAFLTPGQRHERWFEIDTLRTGAAAGTPR